MLLVHTPGHSHGPFSTLLRGEKGYIVPDNDGAYLPESFSKYGLPGFTLDKHLAEKSLNRLIACKNDPLCLGVYANHDSTVEEQVL